MKSNMESQSTKIEAFRICAQNLIQVADENQLSTVIRILLTDQKESQVAKPARTRGPNTNKEAPIAKALAIIGKGTPEEILTCIQNRMNYPVPHDPAEALEWVKRSISKWGSKLRKWPDNSYSKLSYKIVDMKAS